MDEYIKYVKELIWPAPPSPTSGSRLLSVTGSHVLHKKKELETLQDLVARTQGLRDTADTKRQEAEQSHETCDKDIWTAIEARKAALNKFAIQIKRIQNADEQEECIEMLREACVLSDEFDGVKFSKEIDSLKEVRAQSHVALERATAKVRQVDDQLLKLNTQCTHIIDHISTLEQIQEQLTTSMEKGAYTLTEEELGDVPPPASQTGTE